NAVLHQSRSPTALRPVIGGARCDHDVMAATRQCVRELPQLDRRAREKVVFGIDVQDSHALPSRGRAPRLPTYAREQDRATRKLRPFEDVQPQSAGVEGSPRPLVGDDIDRTGAADGRGKLLPIANTLDGASQIKVARKAGAFEGGEIITA